MRNEGIAGNKTLAAEDIATRPVGRRSALAAVATLGGIAALGLGTEACSRGTGCTDSDPSDGVGHGRHCNCTDSDSHDAAGHGTRCTTGCTDHDPSDTAGNGIHCV